MIFEKFRTNLRVLRGSTNLSAVELSTLLGLKSGSRIIDLEYGRAGTPSTEELIIISRHFKITIDDLLNKQAKISFE